MAIEIIGHVVNVLMLSSIYILVALGFALVFSIMRIMNFAHGAIYMIGGFVCYSFWVPMGLGPWLSLLATMVVIGGFGLFLERVCFRPFRKDFEKATIMAIALVIILKTGADLTVGAHSKSMPPIIAGGLGLGGFTLSFDRITVALIASALLIGMMLFIKKTRVGQAMLAIAQDPDGASLMGINTDRISALVCAMGCALAGLAGGLVGSVLVLHVCIADTMLVKIIAVIIIAGIGSIGGIWAGGLAMGILDTLGPYFLPNVVSDPLSLALVVMILVIRPQGLFGQEA
ncbi:MAG: branched-chain amino acid ABC transporter permease [Desulfarculaceae bacterium]|nr:branched-chain amino acid ABC transporter permease [Desulfarculaceae bacterium]